jgi:hypothetical protein
MRLEREIRLSARMRSYTYNNIFLELTGITTDFASIYSSVPALEVGLYTARLIAFDRKNTNAVVRETTLDLDR